MPGSKPAQPPDISISSFSPATRSRSSDVIVEQVRSLITAGQLQPGAQLPNERDLARALEVSRPTLREGLRTLEALGIVELRLGANGGVFIAQPDGDLIGIALQTLVEFRSATARELAEFRTGFEGDNAKLAAQHATDDEAELIAARARTLWEACHDPTRSWPDLLAIDGQFHEEIARAGRNRIRVAIEQGLNRAAAPIALAAASQADTARREWIADTAAAVTDAIAHHDPARAEQTMRRHVSEFAELEIAAYDLTPTSPALGAPEEDGPGSALPRQT